MAKTLKLQIPEKFEPFLRPMRHKVGRGGRGSGKSWTFGRLLLARGLREPIRVLCCREIQNSIKDSVHQLLSDQIKLMGLGYHYDVTQTEIKGRNGTRIIFSGLLSHTVDSIKSFEAIDIAWIEEAHTVSKRSFDILIPTIRKDGSEIWISYNPDLDTDEVHQRFTVRPPGDCINILANWRDNPWFNDVLDKERRHCKERDPDNYPNIWEGECKPAVTGAIYFKEIAAAERQGRIRNVPYDPMLKVHPVLDLGWNDSLGCGLVQKQGPEIRIIEYVEASHTRLDVFSAELRMYPYNWGRLWLPHDGFNGRLESDGRSTADIMGKLGWDVVPREEITIYATVEEGIRNTRVVFPQVYFDKERCHAETTPEAVLPDFHGTDLNWRLIECLKRYRRHISNTTDAAMSPVKDDYTHGADVFRYICANAHAMHNERESRPIYHPEMSYRPSPVVAGSV